MPPLHSQEAILDRLFRSAVIAASSCSLLQGPLPLDISASDVLGPLSARRSLWSATSACLPISNPILYSTQHFARNKASDVLQLFPLDWLGGSWQRSCPRIKFSESFASDIQRSLLRLPTFDVMGRRQWQHPAGVQPYGNSLLNGGRCCRAGAFRMGSATLCSDTA